MKVNTELRMLPFDYLQKIGRYNPEVHRGWNHPGYPGPMMEELAMAAKIGKKIKFVRSRYLHTGDKVSYKCNKFISVEMPGGNQWTIPSNWVVKV